jgi:hypothetical protein
MAKNKSARDYWLYVATSAPTAADEANDANYSLVGLATEHSLSRSRGAIDVSTKDDGDDSSFIAGRRNQTVSMSGIFDHTEDAGYTKLSDAYEAANGTVYFLLTSTNSGDTEWYGSGVITDLSLTFSDESPSTFSTTIQASGTVTEATGTSS